MIAILQGAPAFGAIERYVIAIAEGLRERGEEELALVYPDVPELAPFGELAGDGIRLEPFAPALLSSTPRLLLHLTRTLRRIRPRVVHVNDVWPAAQLAARLARARRLLMTHHTPELPRSDNLVGRAWLALGWLARPEVVYTSHSDREQDGRRGKTHVVYYGIDLERYARGVPTLPRNGRWVGNVARLAEQKGQRLLVDAAPRVLERHPDVHFVLAGDGELREELERLVRERGLADRFLFTGATDDVPGVLASLDVFALPSHFEGLCLAVIEAQAAGVPVVATPVGGVRENVVPGETGLLCEPGDARSLAEGLLWVLDHPDEARRLAENARARVSSLYAESSMVEHTLALYRS